MERESFFRTLNYLASKWRTLNKKIDKKFTSVPHDIFYQFTRLDHIVTLVEQFVNGEYTTIPIKHGTKENPVVKLLSSCF